MTYVRKMSVKPFDNVKTCESEFSSLAVHEQRTQPIRCRCQCECADVSFQPLCRP
jgi:hypothetical protein